jgi:hypothetical protein
VLLHAGRARDVETVIVGGRVQYNPGRPRQFDKAAIEAQLQGQLADPARAPAAEVVALYGDLVSYRSQFEGVLFTDPAHYRYNPAGRA